MTTETQGGPAERQAIGALTVRQYLDDLASPKPTPGGGAAAAVIAATAASLVSMVAELSAGRARFEGYAPTIRRSGAVGRRLGAELMALADADAAAFEAFMAVWRQSKGMEPAERRDALSAAARASAEAPRTILGCCVVIAEACERLAGRSNPNLASDLLCASRAVEAAAHCAADNVIVNLPNIADPADAEGLRSEAKRMVLEVERRARGTRRVVAQGSLREPERRKPAHASEPAGSDAA